MCNSNISLLTVVEIRNKVTEHQREDAFPSIYFFLLESEAEIWPVGNPWITHG